MEFRHLGRSGLKISEIAYGNWITHGGQVEADEAIACVRAALDAGITSFDTADVYAGGRAEQVLGKALYIGVSEWRAEELRAAKALAEELRVPLISNQPQYSALHRVPEAEVIPTSRDVGLSQIVFSPLAQ